MIKNSIRKIVVVTCLLFLKKKPYHRDIASLFLLNKSFNYSLMKFIQKLLAFFTYNRYDRILQIRFSNKICRTTQIYSDYYLFKIIS